MGWAQEKYGVGSIIPVRRYNVDAVSAWEESSSYPRNLVFWTFSSARTGEHKRRGFVLITPSGSQLFDTKKKARAESAKLGLNSGYGY